VLADPRTAADAWCGDFLRTGGPGGAGSCCAKDEELSGWCGLPGSSASPLYRAACDPTASDFGMTPLLLSYDGSTLKADATAAWQGEQAQLWPRLIEARREPHPRAPLRRTAAAPLRRCPAPPPPLVVLIPAQSLPLSVPLG